MHTMQSQKKQGNATGPAGPEVKSIGDVDALHSVKAQALVAAEVHGVKIILSRL